MKRHRHRDSHIDSDHSGPRLVDEPASRGAAAGEHSRAVREFVRADKIYRGLEIRHAYDTQHGPEDLLLIDSHLGCHPVEHGRTQKEPALESSLPTINDKVSALTLPNTDEFTDAVAVCLGDERPHLNTSGF